MYIYVLTYIYIYIYIYTCITKARCINYVINFEAKLHPVCVRDEKSKQMPLPAPQFERKSFQKEALIGKLRRRLEQSKFH